ncbi:heterokaryon incompatibility protein-domain-containing protein [Daedaleopsis nitida]|nr:heterokaryon incompatibility protein-domain-containing protein [Daedaleopsis nitida]
MRLLDTHNFTIHFFDSPEAVPGGYAILSHVWGEGEQSYQDVQDIHARCAVSGEAPCDLLSVKIRRFCELAEDHGYRWGWVDTCCIDKSSSEELSEAINAMSRYYSQCLVCYAHLANSHDLSVSDLDHPNPKIADSDFLHDPWYERGWTLQELIMPRVVIFLSNHWRYLGSKSDLADTVASITGIPLTVIRSEVHYTDISVAERMSWAAKRQTSRVEDEAYCLMGIFDVNMPTLYGEGRKAFQRLQEEILRKTPDTTLFAWGGLCDWEDLEDYGINEGSKGLFATSPSDYQRRLQVEFLPGKQMKQGHPDSTVEFTTTPRGIQSRLRIVEVDGIILADLSWFYSHDKSSRVFLILTRLPRRSELKLALYGIGLRGLQNGTYPRRMVKIPYQNVDGTGNRLYHQSLTQFVMKDILLVHDFRTVANPLYIPINHIFSPRIRIPEHRLDDVFRGYRVKNIKISSPHVPWFGHPPLTISYLFIRRVDWFNVVFQFGRCWSSNSASQAGAPWANVQGDEEYRPGDHKHDCATDHIASWPDLKKRFTHKTFVDNRDDGYYGVRFMRWTFILFFDDTTIPGCFTLLDIRQEVASLWKCWGYRDYAQEAGFEIGSKYALKVRSSQPCSDVPPSRSTNVQEHPSQDSGLVTMPFRSYRLAKSIANTVATFCATFTSSVVQSLRDYSQSYAIQRSAPDAFYQEVHANVHAMACPHCYTAVRSAPLWEAYYCSFALK